MYTKISYEFWEDEVLNSFSRDTVFFFFYLLTNKHRNMTGLYKIGIYYMAEDMKMSPEEIKEHLSVLCEKGLVDYDFNKRMILIKNFLKYNKIENLNQARGAAKIVKKLHSTKLLINLKEIAEELNEDNKLEVLIETLSKKLKNIDVDSSKLLSEQANNLLNPSGNPLGKGWGNPLGNPLGNPYPNPYPTKLNSKEVKQLNSKESTEETSEKISPPLLSKERIPYKQIVEKYHSILPEFSIVEILSSERKKSIKARWNMKKEFQSLEFWEKFFNKVRESDFLIGKTPGNDGRYFSGNIDFLLKKAIFIKILEGFYNRKNSATGNTWTGREEEMDIGVKSFI